MALTDKRLMRNWGTCKTKDKLISGVHTIELDPDTRVKDPSSSLTLSFV